MAVLLIGPGTTRAADDTLAGPLCSVLKKLVPEVRTYRPEGAQAQLVIAVAEAFEYDAATLRQVKEEIDQATTARCPQDRTSMLTILKMKTLAEAVR
jgi:hypothetical protein